MAGHCVGANEIVNFGKKKGHCRLQQELQYFPPIDPIRGMLQI
jgi:hypothetical protein